MGLGITNIYGINGAAYAAMHCVAEVAVSMGAKELSMYVYPVYTDDDKCLHSRLDGILSPLYHNDVIIMQYPTWNGKRYEEMFVAKIKAYRGVKLIIFVHDIEQLMFNAPEESLQETIALLNRADALILSSEKMREYLEKHGLRCNRIFIQEVWDFYTRTNWVPSKFNRIIHFTGKRERFPFINSWNKQTCLETYENDVTIPENCNVRNSPYMENNQLIATLGSKGGFGLIWADEYQDNYYKYNQPFKIAIFIAAGLPVLVKRGTHVSKFVQKTGVGLVIDSLEEADNIVQNIDESKYWELVENVKRQQFPITNGHYTRKVLTDAVLSVCEKPWCPNIMSCEDTVDYLIENQCSVVRLGDGEMDIICGRGIPFQKYDENLAKELEHIIGLSSDENMMICIPDVFEGLNRYTDSAADFWCYNLKENKSCYESLCKAKWYGNALASRPYMMWKDKSKAVSAFDKWMQFWKDKDILLVEGDTSRIGIGNDLFDNAASVSRIICPSKNAYSVIDRIYAMVLDNACGKLIMVSLGPTAKSLVFRLHESGYKAVDIGHIDTEYEWYKMGAVQKVKLSNKHTAEHNYDENITMEYNYEYESQVVARVE